MIRKVSEKIELLVLYRHFVTKYDIHINKVSKYNRNYNATSYLSFKQSMSFYI